jgi:hypothetical protein
VTRADFYVGRGLTAEWLGSIAADGYPEGIGKAVLGSANEDQYRVAVQEILANDEYATLPGDGWPWPWEDSGTTDYAYAWDGRHVWMSSFGRAWLNARDAEPEDDWPAAPAAVFPDMTAVQNVTLGKRSGVIVVSDPTL